MPPSPELVLAGARGRAEGDLVQPGTQRVFHPQPPRLLDQHQESGLEGILRVMRVGQHAPADPPDHRAVPLDQGRERKLRGLAPAGREPLQELPVRKIPDGSDVHQQADRTQDRAILPRRHRLSFRLDPTFRWHRE